MAHYDRLSSLDASFLHMERLEYPMHVGAVSVFEPGNLCDSSGRFRIDDVRDLVEVALGAHAALPAPVDERPVRAGTADLDR